MGKRRGINDEGAVEPGAAGAGDDVGCMRMGGIVSKRKSGADEGSMMFGFEED